MAKVFFSLSLLLSLALLINARIQTVLPEDRQGAVEEILVEDEPKLLLPSEKQPAEPLTLQDPNPTVDDDLFARNRHAHHVFIQRPFLFRFPRRFRHHHHHHDDEHEHEHEHEHDRDHDRDHDDDRDDDRYDHHKHFMGRDGHHFYPHKEGEFEVPIRGAEFEGRFLDEHQYSMGPVWFHGHDHHYPRRHHHDKHRFYPDKVEEQKHRHDKDDDVEEETKGGVFKWFSNLLKMP